MPALLVCPEKSVTYRMYLRLAQAAFPQPAALLFYLLT